MASLDTAFDVAELDLLMGWALASATFSPDCLESAILVVVLLMAVAGMADDEMMEVEVVVVVVELLLFLLLMGVDCVVVGLVVCAGAPDAFGGAGAGLNLDI
jgi:hypothetical protein